MRTDPLGSPHRRKALVAGCAMFIQAPLELNQELAQSKLFQGHRGH